MIIVPEVIIKTILDNGLAFFKKDWEDQTDKTKSYLYMLLGTLSLGTFNFYDQLVEILTRDVTDVRHLEVNYFFNTERANHPTIHITLPNENPGSDGLGIDEGYRDAIPANLDFDEIPVYNRNFVCTYNIVITSENSLEVVALYHFLRSMMISLFIDLENAYISNPKLSGGDITALDNLVPANVFMRNISLNFNYNVPALKLSTIPSFGELIFQGTMLDESSSS